LLVILHKYNVKYRRTVHRLVANAFIRNTKNKEEVNHIDGIKDNNKARNLEWATRVENCHHAIYTLGKDQKGQNHPQAKYTQKQILKVFALWQTGKYSKAEIGRRFGMPRSYAGSVINRRTWKHLII
jgi:hypothetical protein